MQPGRGPFDVFHRLLKERVVFIGTPIDDRVASILSEQLLLLQLEDATKDIHLYINSPGGSVTASLAIYDAMQSIKNDVATYAIGIAEGSALMLLCAGEPGKRFALPHARLTSTKVWGGKPEQLEETKRLERMLVEIFAKHTGQSVEQIEAIKENPRTFSLREALELGLIDEVLNTIPEKHE